jgi:hypothetical protein
MIFAGIIVLAVIAAGVYFVGLPMLGGSKGSSATPSPAAVPTAVPTAVLVPVSPVSVPVSGVTGVPAAGPTYVEKYTETYNLVYALDQPFVGGQKAVFTQPLPVPPLYVRFNITPKMFYDERPVEIGTHNEHIANVSYPSPNAWFRVNVYDADNGALVSEEGFGREHSVTTTQEFMVRRPGNYRVEISGNDVTADVRVLTGRS